MKLFRRWYWLISGIFKKYSLGITLSALLGIAFFIYITRFASKLPSSTVSHLGRVGLYTTAQLPLDVQRQISYGLTTISSDGQTALGAASSMNLSEDGKTYTFNLKPGLTWANGDPLKSSEFTLDSEDIETSLPNDSSIAFTLKEPYAPFPAIVSLPKLKKQVTGRILKRTQIIGFNPPYISNLKTNNQYLTELELKNASATNIYHFYPTEADAITAFKLGKIDKIDALTKPYLTDWPNVKNEAVTQPNRYVALFFNFTNQNLQEKSMRQLLAYATPKGDEAERVISPISKNSWAYNPQVKPYNYNLDTARSLLSKLKEANPQYQPEFTITTTPAYSDFAQTIKNSWEQIGIKTNLKIVPFPDTNDYEILLIGQQIPDDPDQYALWHSTQSTNISHYVSARLDKLLEDGRKENNYDKRREIYQEFQRFLVEDSPAAFLYQLKSYNLSRT